MVNIMSENKERVPGFFLTGDVDFIRKHKGEDGVQKLRQMLPQYDFDSLSMLRSYPLTEELDILTAAAKIVYGNDSPGSWELVGQHEVETIKDSRFFKVLLTFFGKDAVNLIKHTERAFGYFAPFITFKCPRLTREGAIFVIENDPYPKEYYLGIFRAFNEYVNGTGSIGVTDMGNKCHVYEFKWQ